MPQRLYTYRGINIDIKIDEETCTACQLCYEVLPNIFVDRGDGIPLVLRKNINNQALTKIEKVATDCPSSSILIHIG